MFHIWFGSAPESVRERLVKEVAAIQPTHPGSHELLGELYMHQGDYHGALAEYREANQAASSDYPRKSVIVFQLNDLERKARWEGKIGAVMAGTIKPKGAEWLELAGYSALFEKQYALAVGFADQAIKTIPTLADNWPEVTQFAGWAVQAATGNGTDAANLTPAERLGLRKKALAWLTECMKRMDPKMAMAIGVSTLRRQAGFEPVRDPKELAKLPPEGRAEWERFWARIAAAAPLPVAPRPRLLKE